MQMVADYMTQHIAILLPEQRLYHAYQTMQELEIRHLPVVSKEGVLVGILSDRDVRKYMNASFETEHESFEDRRVMLAEVGDVMTKEVISVAPNNSVAMAVSMMLRNKIDALVVVEPDEEKPLGILTSTDLLRLLGERLTEEK